MPSPWISPVMSLALAAAGVAAFHVAYEVESAAAVVVVYLACLFRLAWVKSPRWAFYLGPASTGFQYFVWPARGSRRRWIGMAESSLRRRFRDRGSG